MPAAAPPKGCPPHPLGLIDIHGNMLQRCQDWIDDYPPEGATDPTGSLAPPPSAWRVLRGGSWTLPAANARSA